MADLDDDYIAKMEDVLEVYVRPYDGQQPVICLNEKPVTLRADVRPASPAEPGREARRHHFTFSTPDRSAFEFAQVACSLAVEYPQVETIHLVMDNLNIHCCKSLTDVFGV